jgi:hypothetical protein
LRAATFGYSYRENGGERASKEGIWYINCGSGREEESRFVRIDGVGGGGESVVFVGAGSGECERARGEGEAETGSLVLGLR